MHVAMLWYLATAAPYAVEISTYSIVPYTAKSHPRIALKWGIEALPEINQLRAGAVRKVESSRDCDHVTSAELFDLRSESQKLWTIAIECLNGQKFYVKRSDL